MDQTGRVAASYPARFIVCLSPRRPGGRESLSQTRLGQFHFELALTTGALSVCLWLNGGQNKDRILRVEAAAAGQGPTLAGLEQCGFHGPV